jgi:hypothetical protein
LCRSQSLNIWNWKSENDPNKQQNLTFFTRLVSYIYSKHNRAKTISINILFLLWTFLSSKFVPFLYIMPSGPKKRRAARNKKQKENINININLSSTNNPLQGTYFLFSTCLDSFLCKSDYWHLKLILTRLNCFCLHNWLRF